MDFYDRTAHYYDLEHADYTDDINMYLEFARQTGGPVLELACGSGRICFPLARTGYVVTGLDRSPVMLAQAESLRAAEPDLSERLHFIRGEMTDFRLAGPFGLVIVALNSLMHLTTQAEQVRTLGAIRQHLGLDGRLVIDLPGPDEAWTIQESALLDREFADPVTGRQIQKWTSSRFDRTRQIEEMIVNYDDIDPAGLVRRTTGRLHLRYIFPNELRLLLRTAKLRLIALHGDYDLGPYVDGCPRTIVVAGRN